MNVQASIAAKKVCDAIETATTLRIMGIMSMLDVAAMTMAAMKNELADAVTDNEQDKKEFDKVISDCLGAQTKRFK